MYKVTAEEVKKLRDMTGAGIYDCKRALVHCNGDFKIATLWLKHRYIGPHIDVWGRKIWVNDLYNMRRIGANGLYMFDVKGESANHIREKYKLENNDVFLAICSDGSSGLVGSLNYNDVHSLDESELQDVYRQTRMRLLIAEDLWNEQIEN